MYVPVGVPHAFGNPTDEPAVLFFQSTVGAGHENYFRELKELLTSGSGRPPEAEILRLRKKYHIQQLTGMFVNHNIRWLDIRGIGSLWHTMPMRTGHRS
jgi:hypothetical protein